jgi:hypothetical protein
LRCAATAFHAPAATRRRTRFPEEFLAFRPANQIRITHGPFSVWKHYGGHRAAFFDLRGDEKENLASIEVEVSAVKLELAYARAGTIMRRFGLGGPSCCYADFALLARSNFLFADTFGICQLDPQIGFVKLTSYSQFLNILDWSAKPTCQDTLLWVCNIQAEEMA